MQNRSGLSVTERGTHNPQDGDEENYGDSKDDEDGGSNCAGCSGEFKDFNAQFHQSYSVFIWFSFL